MVIFLFLEILMKFVFKKKKIIKRPFNREVQQVNKK